MQNTRQTTQKQEHINTRQKGAHYEEIALNYLLSLGFTFIAKNFHSRYGEIDLIMQKDSILHFIEVKSSNTMNPLLNITPKKLEKLIKTIDTYLTQQNIESAYCIDAISIYKNEISFFENITL